MNEQDLARSACRIFGHVWERTKFLAYKHAYTGKLTIARTRTCSRCGELEEVR